jgi:hypothetical protein
MEILWDKELGRFFSFCGVHSLRDGPIRQFSNRIACMGSTIWKTLGVLLINALVICCNHGYRSRRRNAVDDSFSLRQVPHLYWHSWSLTGLSWTAF